MYVQVRGMICMQSVNTLVDNKLLLYHQNMLIIDQGYMDDPYYPPGIRVLVAAP